MNGCAGAKRDPRTPPREAAVQAVFQIAVTQAPAAGVIQQFLDHPITGAKVARKPLFRRIVAGVSERMPEIDETIRPFLGEHWTLERMDTTVLCVLRCGVWELMHAAGATPARVVITEYLKVSRGFAEEREIKFINALLDRVARSVRAGEFT